MTTTLEQAVHAHWAATNELTALLPAARVTTGRSSAEALPYAVLERARCRVILPNNRGDAVEDVLLRVHVWHADHDAGRAVVDQVAAAFDRAELALEQPDRIARIRRTSETVAQDDGLWMWTVELSARVHEE